MQRSTLQWHAGWCQNAITNPRTSDTVCSGPLMLTPPTPPSFPPKAPTSPTGGQYPSLAGSISNVSWVNPTHLNMHCYSLSCPHLPALLPALPAAATAAVQAPTSLPLLSRRPLQHINVRGANASAIQCTTEQPSTSAQINQPSRPPAAPKGQQRHRQTCVHTVTLTRGPQQQQQRQ